MEQVEIVFVVEMNMWWSDVGIWIVLVSIKQFDEVGNVVLVLWVMFVNVFNSVVISEIEYLILGIGFEDLIVVYSFDVMLICCCEDEQLFKELVDCCWVEFGEIYE